MASSRMTSGRASRGNSTVNRYCELLFGWHSFVINANAVQHALGASRKPINVTFSRQIIGVRRAHTYYQGDEGSIAHDNLS